MAPAVLLLGFGQTAAAVLAAQETGTKCYATTRNPMRVFDLYEYPLEPVIMPVPSAEIVEPLARDNDVLVSFPPDGTTDAILAPACRNARSIVYISSTGVYGAYRGKVTDETPVATDEATAKTRLEAEKIWQNVGATVLRAPGIYGPDNGLHVRMLNNAYSIPGDGTNVLSRIHVDDLAQFVMAVWAKQVRSETYVVGDETPVPQIEVVTWLCERMELQLPRFAPLDAVSPTMRGNRAVDPTRALKELGVTLRYPGYKDGFESCLKH